MTIIVKKLYICMLSMRVCFYQCIAYRQIRYTITEDIMTKKTVRNTKKTIVSINERDYISLTDMVIKY